MDREDILFWQREEEEMDARRRMTISRRRAKLIDWLKHPTGLPSHPAIRPENAMWTAQEIVEASNLYETRRACLNDLNVLRRSLVVGKHGNRWRYEGWAQ